MILTDKTKGLIKSHALRENPKECCGLVIKNKEEVDVFNCRNSSEKPTLHFSIHPSDYARASRRGSVEAIYHSHIGDNNHFSVNDIFQSRSHNTNFILYCIGKDDFSLFNPQESGKYTYNKPFKTGETDCYTVVKEYYQDMGIELAGRNDLGEDWFNKNPDLIQDLFDLNKSNPDLPITQLSPNEKLKKHDVIVFEFVEGSGPNHVGVYLGDDHILHHPRNKYMCIERLNNSYKRRIYKIYRHTEL